MKKILILTAAFILFSAGGCATDNAAAKLPPDAQEQERKLGNDLLAAMKNEDGKKFTALLPQETKVRFTAKNFKTSLEDLGNVFGRLESFEFLTALETPAPFRPLLWKVRFRKKTTGGKTVFQETLFRIITGKDKDGKLYVLSFGFL